MDSATFKKRCDNMKNGHFSGDEALMGSARNGLFETKLLLEALWECCARLETSNSMLKSANRTLDEQNRRLKDRVQELEAKR